MQDWYVYYQKPEFFRDGILGLDWLKERNMVPKPYALGETHVYLNTVEAESLEDLFQKMQGEVWSPNGEARSLIKKKRLQHTSMSVGDIAVDKGGIVWIADIWGWKKITMT